MQQNRYDRIEIKHKQVKQKPRITPGYIMRDLPKLPAIYGTMELPTIDNILYYRFKEGDYIFSGSGLSIPEKQYPAEQVHNAL
jgi:hypothetical protein